MILYPAIDILHGRAVRLRQGDFEEATVYEDEPLDAARAWVQSGASHLHVVDLDGAKAGEPRNLHQLERIAAELPHVPVQYGGGLRSERAVADALSAGAQTAVLGTIALTDPRLVENACNEHGAQRIAVSIDARGGRATTSGWQTSTQRTPDEVIADLRQRGVGRFIYTDVERDGMLGGPDLDGLTRLAGLLRDGERIICSGGIGTLDDLRALGELDEPRIAGAIVGKALYERRFTIADALQALA